jgi:acetylornithine deacetylase/succinyl-diaminopimelate desuccinylase-like protein
MDSSRPLRYAGQHRNRFLQELKDLVRFPTVSAQANHQQDLKKCAAWLADHLRKIGLRTSKSSQQTATR